MSAVSERFVPLDGCFNFRDLGGYGAGPDRRVRPGRLFRSDGLHQLSPADVRRLEALGVTTVIDLRTDQELDAFGRASDRLSLSAYHHLPLTTDLAAAVALLDDAEAASLARCYRHLAAVGAETIAEILAVLTDPSAYPAVVHCSAGKDRTGLVVAVILALLGVDHGVIADDYALSGPALQRMVDHLERRDPGAAARVLQSAPALIAAPVDAMHAFLAGLSADHGSVQGYVDGLGVGSATAHLRRALLG